MVLKTDLQEIYLSKLRNAVLFKCLNTTDYDIDIRDYMCTPSCRIPTENELIVHDWPSNITRPELGTVSINKISI